VQSDRNDRVELKNRQGRFMPEGTGKGGVGSQQSDETAEDAESMGTVFSIFSVFSVCPGVDKRASSDKDAV